MFSLLVQRGSRSRAVPRCKSYLDMWNLTVSVSAILHNHRLGLASVSSIISVGESHRALNTNSNLTPTAVVEAGLQTETLMWLATWRRLIKWPPTMEWVGGAGRLPSSPRGACLCHRAWKHASLPACLDAHSHSACIFTSYITLPPQASAWSAQLGWSHASPI